MANLRVDKITSTETFETTGSTQFDGSNDDLSAGSAGDFNYLHDNTASFTAEFWVYPQLLNSRQTIFSTGGNSSSTGFCVRIMGSGDAGSSNGYLVGAQTSKSSSGNYLYWDSESTQLDADTWYHIATVYDNTDETLKIYVDGKLTNSGFPHVEGTFGSHSTSNSSYALNVGQEPYGNTMHLKGHLSNLRILNGVKLYTSNFKPPMRELEVIPGTTLLTCQSKTSATLDASGSHTITSNGGPPANELTPGLLTPIPKAGAGSAITGSVEFDGTGDYLTLANSSDFNFGTGDFTVECFIHVNKHLAGATDVIVSTYQDSSNGWTLGIHGHSPADKFYFAIAGDSSQLDSSVLYTDSWVHLAASRSGSTAKLFINGVEAASASNSTNQTSTSDLHIGTNVGGGALSTEGFISNLRVVKGTALYTDDFIPPTRELKKVPGTVLLCCQDPDSPLTEATGKTITGYGDLQQDSPELVTDGEFESASNWSSAASDWTVGSGQAVINSSNSGYDYLGQLATGLLNGQQYEFVFNVTNYSTGRLELSQSGAGNIGVESPNGRNVFRFTYTGTAGGAVGLYSYTANTASFTLTNVSLKRVFASRSGSNFTPQVGDDRKVTFEGVTKVNSDAYFYLPTGDTVTKDSRSGYGNRGLFSLGAAPAASNIIEFVTIPTTGNSIDFGNLTYQNDGSNASCSSSTRGIFAGGRENPSPGGNIDHINYVTIASTGDAEDFGNLTEARRGITGYGSGIRGMFAGGRADPGGSNPTDVIDFITIASTGNALDFGNMSEARRYLGSTSSPVRGVMAGGFGSPARVNTIDYVTIPSKGNAIDFGNLTQTRDQIEGNSNGVRGIFGGGSEHPTYYNIIDYVTIASTGNAQDFGDLLGTTGDCATASNCIRGVFAGGNNPTKQDVIQYVSISSMGNAFDFGNLTAAASEGSGCSDSHGGLG